MGLLVWLTVACGGSPADSIAPSAMQSKQISFQECQLHFLEMGNRVASKSTVVLLHGARFSAQTWAELGTLQSFAAAGHRVLAIDLPGFGKSTGSPPGDRGTFLADLLDELGADPCALITPSMSGSYAIPFLVQFPERVSHFLPVASVGIPAHLAALAELDTPTLALWGELDQVVPLETGQQLMAAMPHARIHVFPGASHPCYLDASEAFHQAVLAFLAPSI